MDTNSDPIAALTEAFNRLPELESENAELRESISDIKAQLAHEDEGWRIVSGVQSGEHVDGLELDEVQKVAALIQPKVAAGSMAGRAVDLHTGFVFGRGMSIEGLEKPAKATRGAKSGLIKFYEDFDNQEAIFNTDAQSELQKARFVEGNVLLACNTKTKKVSRIPFHQIEAVRTDPDFPERIRAYKRTWTTQVNGEDKSVSRWYLTRRFTDRKPQSFTSKGKSVPVDQDVIIVDFRANRQTGFTFGIPDGLRGIHWSQAYTEHIRHGQVVTEGLSRLIFKITNVKSKAGAQNAGVKMGSFTGNGGMAAVGEGQDVEAVRTAGNAYAFEKLRPIAALAAAAWNVSNADLLNDSAAAGASYGALSGLVVGNRNAMTLMQKQWANVYQDVFEVFGFGRPEIHWEPLEAPDPYRAAQALTLLAPTLHNAEYRKGALDILDMTGDPNETPETLAARVAQANTNGASAGTQQASPNQGQNSPSGAAGSSDSNDLRSDTLTNSLRKEMANDDFLAKFEQLVIRAENLSNN